MRKALLGILILIIFISSLTADPEEASGSRTITGYKNLQTGTVPDSICLVRIIDPNTLDVAEDENLPVPLAYRSSDYQAFSFYFYGTKWGYVQISFTFKPMWLGGQENSPDYIPYSVTMTHDSSLVSGTSVPINRQSVATIGTKCSFLQYWFVYADQVQVSSGGAFTEGIEISDTVDNSEITLSFKYNLKEYTKVQNVNGDPAQYSGDVCDYWNRNGTCTVNLDITAAGKHSDNTSISYKNGTYSASVVVNITPN